MYDGDKRAPSRAAEPDLHALETNIYNTSTRKCNEVRPMQHQNAEIEQCIQSCQDGHYLYTRWRSITACKWVASTLNRSIFA